MTTHDDGHVGEALVEVALGQLAGRDRAGVIGHVEQCLACQREVRELSATVDAVMLLAPATAPPPGFEGRVLAELSAPRPAPPLFDALAGAGRGRAVAAGRAAAVAAALLVAGTVGLAATRDQERVATETVELTAIGTTVGLATITDHDPPILTMTMDGDRLAEAYRCQLALADGRLVDLGEFQTAGDLVGWSGTVDVDPAQIQEIRVLDESGRVLAAGTVT